MDSGEDKPDEHPVYAGLVDFDRYRDEQREWLATITQTQDFQKANFRIVLVHIPPYSDSKGHGAADITKKWGHLFEQGKVDLIISGHNHRYSKINEDATEKKPPVLILGKDMFMKTDVSSHQLSIVVSDLKGEVVDKFVIPSQIESGESDK